MSTAKAKPSVRDSGPVPACGVPVKRTRRHAPSQRYRSLPRPVRALSASPADDGQPEGMPWALLVLSWVLHQTPRYGDRCLPACCRANAATSGGLLLPRTATLRHTSTPARSGQGAAEKSGTGRPMGRRSHWHCREGLGACRSKIGPQRTWRACPTVWAFPRASLFTPGRGRRIAHVGFCRMRESTGMAHKAQELTWQISRAVIADRSGCPSGRCPRPGKDPS
jgi:hypothetical protein